MLRPSPGIWFGLRWVCRSHRCRLRSRRSTGAHCSLEQALVLAISQSGASPDLRLRWQCERRGAPSRLGLVNEAGSALGRVVDAEIEIGAGAELAVAATKSFVLSPYRCRSSGGRVELGTRSLLKALESLACDAYSVRVRRLGRRRCDCLTAHEDVFVVGRGPTLPIAREFALKLKEVCGIHAEAMSAAELLHGPISIASPLLPAIVLAGDRYARPTVEAAVSRLRAAGSAVVLVATGSKSAERRKRNRSDPAGAGPAA